MAALQTILAFLVMIGLVITLHEWGHYRMAKAFNIKIKRFSIGFGKPLWRTLRGPDRTEFVLSMIPLGGYVQMLDEREGPVAPEEAVRAFNRQSVFKRFAVVAAGPLVNLLLAVLLFWGILYFHGEQDIQTVIAAPDAGTRAAAAGLHERDRVIAVAGLPVTHWSQLHERLVDAVVGASVIPIAVRDAQGRERTLSLDLSGFNDGELGRETFARIGLTPYFPPIPPVVSTLEAAGPAERGGLAAGDRVLSVNGNGVNDFKQIADIVKVNPDQLLHFVVERSGSRVQLNITPARHKLSDGDYIGRIGAGPDAGVVSALLDTYRVNLTYSAVGAAQESLRKSGEMIAMTLRVLGKMLTGSFSVRNLSGPLTMADYAGETARIGLIAFLGYVAVVSLNIGLFNLFPIPLLDGGHLMYYTVEMITGAPVSERVMEIGQRIGIAVLATLMGVAIYNDISRIFTAS